jgi:hypothetical protein
LSGFHGSPACSDEPLVEHGHPQGVTTDTTGHIKIFGYAHYIILFQASNDAGESGGGDKTGLNLIKQAREPFSIECVNSLSMRYITLYVLYVPYFSKAVFVMFKAIPYLGEAAPERTEGPGAAGQECA